jgi:hypothetical protein
MTGLAAGMASGLPVLEAAAHPGGICWSYYLAPGRNDPLAEPPEDDDAYRFEIGGGHWLFGGEPSVLRFIAGLGPVRRYERRSSVYFPETRRYVPYPIQNHLRFFDHPTICRRARRDGAATGTRLDHCGLAAQRLWRHPEADLLCAVPRPLHRRAVH